LAWTIEVSDSAERQFERLDRSVQTRIRKFLRDRVATLQNPRSSGEALKGNRFGDLSKYRVGDFRIIANIEDERLLILVLRIGHRREIYR